jgi:hypothetical protein
VGILNHLRLPIWGIVQQQDSLPNERGFLDVMGDEDDGQACLGAELQGQGLE